MSTRFAIIVSRFPKFTETFILQELRGLEARGLDFELYSIIHESPEQLQPDAAALDARARYTELRDGQTWAAQWWWLRHHPLRYVRTFAAALWISRRPLEALVRAPVVAILAAAMARDMLTEGIDRVHAHWATYPTLAAWIIRHLTGLPYSFTAHAHDIFIDFGGLTEKVTDADLVLTCTDFGRSRLVRAAPQAADRVIVVHHGVNLDRFELTPRRDRSDGVLRILCVASLEAYKGHRHLIDAVRLLVDRGVEVRLVLIGEGDERPNLEAQVQRLGLADRVELRGRRPVAEVREALVDCDVFALGSVQLPSGFMDGIPNVLVEALAVGRPVVASELPGIAELIEDEKTGLLVRSGDAASLADALERVHRDHPLVERIVAGGRARVEAEHDASVCLDEVYRRLAGLGPR